MTNLPKPRYLAAGESALVVEFGDAIDPKIHDRVLALDAAIGQAKWLHSKMRATINLSLLISNAGGIVEKMRWLIPNMTQHLLQAGPVIGTAVSLASGNAWAALIPGSDAQGADAADALAAAITHARVRAGAKHRIVQAGLYTHAKG